MAEITAYAPGRFCWADLGTTDMSQAKKLYTELFQWEFRDIPLEEGMVYTMALVGGREVAGLYQMDEKERGKGWLPRWQAYVSVADAEAAAGKARELGARIIAAPFDVHEAGRMAVIQDPGGALLSLWESRQHMGARLVGEPGSICWNELLTRDIDQAANFYTRLFGWKAEVMEPAAAGPYTIFKQNNEGQAGMMTMPPECGPEVPSSWMVYFMVADCDASAAKAENLGAKIMKSAADIPTVGRFAVLQDAQRAVFSLFTPSQPPEKVA
ncbi:MAG TPA: VOC family protein [Desulfuromonadaceae bacterium]|jgi:hypothetical protein